MGVRHNPLGDTSVKWLPELTVSTRFPMTNLLIVDDLRDYCDELAQGLGKEGHEVLIATSAEEAIKVGSLFRPDVLITDWMLENHIHGLSVAEALRVIRPATKTILMTGYASGDLRGEAQRAGVSAFLEKPFPMSGMREAVRKVINMQASPDRELPIGFIEVDSSGEISYQNTGAQLILDASERPSSGLHFSDLFGERYRDQLPLAEREWIAVGPPDHVDPQWRLRARRLADSDKTMYVLLPEDSAPYLMDGPVVSRLLGLEDPLPNGFEYDGHVLVVDDLESIRLISAELIRQTGGICLTASNHAEGIHLFAHDARIGYVLLDYDMPDGPPVGLVERIRGLRPQVKIIGCSGGGHEAEFSELGVSRYLAKPWHMSELLDAFAR